MADDSMVPPEFETFAHMEREKESSKHCNERHNDKDENWVTNETLMRRISVEVT